jgi:amino acid transporter
MEKTEGRFERLLGAWDMTALAFGAAIGWGWVVLSGKWLLTGGTLGAILGFALGGCMILFVGMTYSELCPAMPECGGEMTFSKRALGFNWSFVCAWALSLCYLGCVIFETCALPSVFELVDPAFSQVYLYSVAGSDVYLTYALVGSVGALVIMLINYFGIRFAAWLQKVMTITLAVVGITLIVSALISGSLSNIKPLFANGVKGTFSVAIVTPFFLMGFDVIPQASEEANFSPKKLAKILILSIILAASWYCIIIFSVSLVMDHNALSTSQFCTADALARAWHTSSKFPIYVIVIAGLAGILSTWNAFLVSGSRVIFAMACEGMLPKFLAKIDPKHKTPSNAILLLGGISCIAPFFGRDMLVWISDAASFSTVIAYGLVAVSFVVLRKKEPEMPRPYKVKNWKLVGTMAILLCIGMFVLYLPGMPSGLKVSEWSIIALWSVFGVCMFLASHKHRQEILKKQSSVPPPPTA